MTLQPLLIAPFQSGLQQDLQAWLAPPDSFKVADNVHIRYGFIEKRDGFRKFGQMKELSTSSAISAITQANPGVVTVGSTAAWSNGDLVYIEGVGGMTEVNGVTFTVAAKTGTTFELAGVDTTGFGAYTVGGTAYSLADHVERVMGIYKYLQADAVNLNLAFSTEIVNIYDSTLQKYVPINMNGNDLNGDEFAYVWATQWQSINLPNRLYFTNGKPFDGVAGGIFYYSSTTNDITILTPAVDAVVNSLYGCVLLFVFKDRLLAMNTFEGTAAATAAHFPQRLRWCQATAPSNWDATNPSNGGFVDAPTGDQIVTARQLEDQIIVYFTNSIWAIVPNPGSPTLPFRWIKLNDFRAADGKMASTIYDRNIRAIGIRGIVASNGVENQRIDNGIQRFTSNEINTDQFKKVFCLRNYSARRWWTLFASKESNENDSALIYDDNSGAFTTYTINMNCLGYGDNSEDYALNDFVAANDLDIDISEAGENTLQDYFWQNADELILGGNLEGEIFVMETEGSDDGDSIEVELLSAAWNPFKEQGISCFLSYLDIYADTQELTTAKIEFFKDSDTSPYKTQHIDFLPNLNYVSPIVNVILGSPTTINSPQHGLTSGDTIFIYGVNGTVAINGGPFIVTVLNDTSFTIPVDSTAYGAYTFGGGLYLRKFYKTKIWKRAYAGATGYEHRVRITSSGVDRSLHIDSFKPYFAPRGTRSVN